MGLDIKTFTGRDIVEAIEKDGFGIIRQDWISQEPEGLSACLLGMAALNLGVYATIDVGPSSKIADKDYSDLTKYALFNQLNSKANGVGHSIITAFDANKPITEILATKITPQPLDGDYYNEETGDIDYEAFEEDLEAWEKEYQRIKKEYLATISPDRLNSKADYADSYEEDSNFYDGEFAPVIYNLSWDEAIAMVKEKMAPYLDTEFELLVEDYKELYDWTPPTL